MILKLKKILEISYLKILKSVVLMKQIVVGIRIDTDKFLLKGWQIPIIDLQIGIIFETEFMLILGVTKNGFIGLNVRTKSISYSLKELSHEQWISWPAMPGIW